MLLWSLALKFTAHHTTLIIRAHWTGFLIFCFCVIERFNKIVSEYAELYESQNEITGTILRCLYSSLPILKVATLFAYWRNSSGSPSWYSSAIWSTISFFVSFRIVKIPVLSSLKSDKLFVGFGLEYKCFPGKFLEYFWGLMILEELLFVGDFNTAFGEIGGNSVFLKPL